MNLFRSPSVLEDQRYGLLRRQDGGGMNLSRQIRRQSLLVRRLIIRAGILRARIRLRRSLIALIRVRIAEIRIAQVTRPYPWNRIAYNPVTVSRPVCGNVGPTMMPVSWFAVGRQSSPE